MNSLSKQVSATRVTAKEINRWQRELSSLRKQRNKLLKALKAAKPIVANFAEGEEAERIYDAMCDAIDQAESKR